MKTVGTSDFWRGFKGIWGMKGSNNSKVGIGGIDSMAKQRCGEMKVKGKGSLCGHGCAWRGIGSRGRVGMLAECLLGATVKVGRVEVWMVGGKEKELVWIAVGGGDSERLKKNVKKERTSLNQW